MFHTGRVSMSSRRSWDAVKVVKLEDLIRVAVRSLALGEDTNGKKKTLLLGALRLF
jgi:hypothetical protein